MKNQPKSEKVSEERGGKGWEGERETNRVFDFHDNFFAHSKAPAISSGLSTSTGCSLCSSILLCALTLKAHFRRSSILSVKSTYSTKRKSQKDVRKKVTK